eukprot:12027264-Karenia_brevis.AAC.1
MLAKHLDQPLQSDDPQTNKPSGGSYIAASKAAVVGLQECSAAKSGISMKGCFICAASRACPLGHGVQILFNTSVPIGQCRGKG